MAALEHKKRAASRAGEQALEQLGEDLGHDDGDWDDHEQIHVRAESSVQLPVSRACDGQHDAEPRKHDEEDD